MEKKKKIRILVKLLLSVLVVFILLNVGEVLGLERPHDWDPENISCNTCHNLHNAPGMDLTSIAGNANLCMSCHKSGGSAEESRLVSSDRAIPGTSGTSHAWSVPVENSTYETREPTLTEMATRLDNDNNVMKIMCSTCHDQHESEDGGAYWGRRLREAIPNTSNTSTAFVVAGTVDSSGVHNHILYDVYQITVYASDTFDWTRKYEGGGASGVSMNVGNPIDLGNNITVTFYKDGGSYVNGDTWTIKASIPYLRVQNDQDQMCKDCHYKWSNNNDYNRISTDPTPNLTTYASGEYHSHPTGYILNANGKGYDYSTPQDVGAGDRNESNDLPLDSGDRVQCQTCHRMHYCDSITSTKDGR